MMIRGDSLLERRGNGDEFFLFQVLLVTIKARVSSMLTRLSTVLFSEKISQPTVRGICVIF